MKKKSGGTNYITGPYGASDHAIALKTQTGIISPVPSNHNHPTSSFAANAELITDSQQAGGGSLSKKYKLIGKLLNNLSNKYKKNVKTNLKLEINKLKL
jgi:hypothetical protein